MTVLRPHRCWITGKWGGLFHLLASHSITFLENFAFSSISCVSFGLKVLIPALTWEEKTNSFFQFILCYILVYPEP